MSDTKAVEPLPENFDSDRVVGDAVVARLLDVSIPTLYRMRKLGQAPKRLQISQNRFGTRLRDLRDFLNSRSAA